MKATSKPCMGAEAIKKRLQDFDLEAAAKELREEIETSISSHTRSCAAPRT